MMLAKKIDSGLSKLEREKAKAAGWTSDKLDELSDTLSSSAKDAKAKAEDLHDYAHRDDPKGLKKLGQDIKQTALDAKHGTEDRLHSAKDSVVGSVSSIKNTIVGEKNHAEAKIDEAVDSGSRWLRSTESKADELAKESQRSLQGWGETAKQNADAYYDSLHPPRKSTNWFNWGGSKDAEDTINAAYADAQKVYNDAKKKFDSSKPSLFSWNQDEAKQKAHDEAQRQLDYAQKQLDAASDKLQEWKQRAKEALSVQSSYKSNAFYNWLRDGYPPQK